MNSQWLRAFSVLVLVIGVAMAAAGGARLGDGDFSRAVADGRAELAGMAPASRVKVDPGNRILAWTRDAIVLFSGGIALIVAGGVGARLVDRQARRNSATANNHLNWPHEIDAIVTNLTGIQSALALQGPDVPALRGQIERVQLERLDPLLAAKNQLEQRYGLGGFVAVIGPLSGAERLLNRTWTTLVDHHVVEARTSIALSLAAFAETDAALTQLGARD